MTRSRLVQQCQDRIQGWYICRVVQQEKLNECRAEYKEKIGKAIRQRNFNNMYGNTQQAEIAIAAAEIAGETTSTGSQTLQVFTAEKGIQTEAAHLTALQDSQALVILDTGDVHVVKTVMDPQAGTETLAEVQPPSADASTYSQSRHNIPTRVCSHISVHCRNASPSGSAHKGLFWSATSRRN